MHLILGFTEIEVFLAGEIRTGHVPFIDSDTRVGVITVDHGVVYSVTSNYRLFIV